MADLNGASNAASVEPTEDDDFDINAEELPTEDDQTPAVSALEQEEDEADVETDDEDIPDNVRGTYRTRSNSPLPEALLCSELSSRSSHLSSFHQILPWQGETSLQVQKEIAKREKERLRLQEKQRKANLEKMRLEQDQVASAGDVSSLMDTLQTQS